MRTSIVLSVCAVSTLALFAVACGGSDSGGNETATDAGGKTDSGAHDAGNVTPPRVDAGVDGNVPPPDDGSVPEDTGVPVPDAGFPVDGSVVEAAVDAGPPVLNGTLAVAGQFTIWGVTSDGFVVYTDTTGAAWALSLAAAAQPEAITTGLNNYGVVVTGDVVFFWNNVDANSNLGAFSAWTSTSGYKASIAAASTFGFAAASPDGKTMIYSSNATTTVTDIIGSNTDGTGIVSLQAGVADDPNGCQPLLSYVGAVPVVGSCTSDATPADANGPLGAITAFGAAPAWTAKIVVASTAAPFSFNGDTAGTKIFTTDSSNNAIVASLTGAPAANVDTNVYAGLMTNDGTEVVYGNENGDLRSSPTVSPSPEVLIATKVQGFYTAGLSSDGKWLMMFENVDQNSGFSDLFLASTTTPGTPKTLTSAQTAGIGFNGQTATYTADNTYALWADTFDMNTFIATLHATDIATGTSATLGTGVWSNVALTGTKVAFVGNTAVNSTNGILSTGDIAVVDTATGSPSTLATQVSVNFGVSPAHDKIIYAFGGAPAASDGIYVVAVP